MTVTLGGTMRREARGAVGPAVREGRVSRLNGATLLVSVRSLMGDAKPVPARGWEPRVTTTGTLDRVMPSRGDRVWVAADEGGSLVVVAWEPA